MLISTVLVSFTLVTTVKSNAIPINVPGTVPSGMSNFVDHAYPSFAFETSSFPPYAGNRSHPNTFSRNLIETVSNKTGKGVLIRVGGTSGDHGKYDPKQTEPIIRPPSQDGKNVPLNITIGPSYFESFGNFPGSKYIWQVTMAPSYSGALGNSIKETEAAIEAIGLSNLDSLEIGNEPNVYPGIDRPRSWGPAEYVQQWLQYAEAISSAITLPAGPIYQALSFASGAQAPWNVKNTFDDGLNKGGIVKSVSEHHYQTIVTPKVRLNRSLMNHTAIVAGLEYFSKPITYLKQNDPEIPFILAEVGSALNPVYNDNQLEGVLGSALWTVDYMLYAMSIGVVRVNMQQGVGFGYAAWQPVDHNGKPPHVRAPYYGIVFVADFIGTAPKLNIANIDLKSESSTAYAGYESGQLMKLAIINLDEWNSTTPTSRPVQQYSLSLPKDVVSVKVERLTGPGASSFTGITWGGMSWDYENQGHGVQVVEGEKNIPVAGGMVTISVLSSEAVLVSMVR